MRSIGVFDDSDARDLLSGDAARVSRGLERWARRHRDGVCGWLRRRFPGLSSEDLADVWHDALAALLDALRARRLDDGRPVVAWVTTVAFRRATDLTRRRRLEAEALRAVGSALERTRTGERWRRLAEDERRTRFERLREAIGSLPPRQRLVLEVFSNHYPRTASMDYLREQASIAAGEDLSLPAVKRALQEGRRKMRELIDGDER